MNLWAFALGLVLTVAATARADVVVLSNRTPQQTVFHVQPHNRAESTHKLAAGDLLSLPVDGPVKIRFGAKDAERELLIEANSVCFFFYDETGSLDLNRIGFAAEANTAATEARTQDQEAVAAKTTRKKDPFRAPICTVPVKILVDDEEPYVRKVWEKRLRDRVKRASAILEKHCRVRFEVVAADTWDTENGETDFRNMLAEFEREVPVRPAALAIGFSSQRLILEQRIHLGGTFAPLRQHILIREWSKSMSDADRLEVLLHELGHYLGATHSPEQDSAMRPRLNDGKANLATFRLGYDPVNTLIMCLVGEEIRDRKVRLLKDLSSGTRQKLRSIYAEIAKITPDDSASVRLMQLLGDGSTKANTTISTE